MNLSAFVLEQAIVLLLKEKFQYKIKDNNDVGWLEMAATPPSRSLVPLTSFPFLQAILLLKETPNNHQVQISAKNIKDNDEM